MQTTGFDRLLGILATADSIDGFAWEAKQMPTEDHGSVILRSHYFGLLKAFEGWRVDRDPETGAIAGGFDGVRKHYERLSKRLGYDVSIPEGLINQLGYESLKQEDFEKAIMIFKFNVARYPESANVYDSLAEAYEKAGRLKLAKTNCSEAVRRGTSLESPNLAIYQANLDRVTKSLATEEETLDN